MKFENQNNFFINPQIFLKNCIFLALKMSQDHRTFSVAKISQNVNFCHFFHHCNITGMTGSMPLNFKSRCVFSIRSSSHKGSLAFLNSCQFTAVNVLCSIFRNGRCFASYRKMVLIVNLNLFLHQL